jgi:hypothetical protein
MSRLSGLLLLLYAACAPGRFDAARAWQRTRASLAPGAETVYYFWGEIHRAPPAGTRGPLFRFEGFNVARLLPGDGRPVLVSREAGFYLDPSSGERLRCWNGKRVLPVWNDPVSFPLGEVPYDSAGDQVVFHQTIVLAYPSPLAGPAYAPYSADDLYQSTEVFTFFVPRRLLAEPRRSSVPAALAWTRVGPPLPWMQLGATDVRLVYTVRGHKLERGWADLPARIRSAVAAENPAFAHAPETLPSGPNATSWRYFKQELDAGRYTPACGEEGGALPRLGSRHPTPRPPSP